MDATRNCEAENTRAAEGQRPAARRLTPAPRDARYRVLFIGNSITRHGPKPEIGWTGDWGMAASRAERDYVHLVMAGIRALRPGAAHRIAQLAAWERDLERAADALMPFAQAARWDADLIVVRIGENIPGAGARAEALAAAFLRMIDFFNPAGRARVVISDLFWPQAVKDEALRRVAHSRGYPLVSLNALGMRDEMKALGLFEHAGVAAHPGDLGMRAIADALLAAIRPLLA